MKGQSTLTPHTSCARGKRVRVVLRDGEIFFDKFLEKKGKFRTFFSGRVVKAVDIKAFSIIKGIPQPRS